MPFWRTKNVNPRDNRKLSDKIFQSRENPNNKYDLSDCGINVVPNETYGSCQVLNKEVLFLFSNNLSSLKQGGAISQLSHLKVLDVHDNKFSIFPSEILELSQLQFLDISSNKICSIPQEINKLQNLQSFNLRSNILEIVDKSLSLLHRLRNLDISDNLITSIPKEFSALRMLESLVLDKEKMKYPPTDICCQSTQAVMMYLCNERGIVYEPPSKFIVDEKGAAKSVDRNRSEAFRAEADLFERDVFNYQKTKDGESLKLLELEHQLLEEKEKERRLSEIAIEDRQTMLENCLQAVKNDDAKLHELLLLKDRQQEKIVQQLAEVEENSATLVQNLVQLNEKSRHMELLTDQLEQERINEEKLFKIYEDEVDCIRREDIANTMLEALKNDNLLSSQLKVSQSQQALLVNEVIGDQKCADTKMKAALACHSKHNQELASSVQIQEVEQKQAFECLLRRQDMCHQRLTDEIDILERQLGKLTSNELRMTDECHALQKKALAEERRMTADLLMQLMEERVNRQKELGKRLREMEELRENEHIDYWMVMFQRLLDQKPQSLIDKENQLELAVLQVLQDAGAKQYISLFARNRISIETLCSLKDDELKQLGVSEFQLRRNIIELAKKVMVPPDCPSTSQQLPSQKKPTISQAPSVPSVPTSPSAPIKESQALGVNTECAICMDAISSILFIPCAHVCCCLSCSASLEDCPLCRARVVQKILLAVSPETSP